MSASFTSYLRENIHIQCLHNPCFILPTSSGDIFRLETIAQICQFLLENIAKAILANKTSNILGQFKLQMPRAYLKELSMLPIHHALFYYLEDLGIRVLAIHHDGTLEVAKSDSCQFKPCRINFKIFFLGQRVLLSQLYKKLPMQDILSSTILVLSPPTCHFVPQGQSSLFQFVCLREIWIERDRYKMVKHYFDHLVEKLDPLLQHIQNAIDHAKEAKHSDLCIELPLVKKFLFKAENLDSYENVLLSFFPMFHFIHTYFVQQGAFLTKISSDGKLYFQLES
ncbi:MAG: hypothetical protein K940chlam8_01203 [Chlamydiae bacterium]|nr:hypothetical protein [Chlamydiota bacterium]